MKPLTLSLLLIVAGCAADRSGLSDAEILTQAPLVIGGGGGAPASIMAPDEARRRLDAAREAFYREEYRECLRIVREALPKHPPADVEAELRSLRYEAKRRLVSRQVLAVKALPVRDVCATGQPVEVNLVLRNVTDVPVRVPESSGDSSPSLFFLKVKREYWDIFGNVRSEEERARVRLEEAIDVPVGGRRSVTYRAETTAPERRHFGFTLFRVSGTFRPAVIFVGDEEFHSGLPVKECVVRVLPPGYEPIAADPLGTLRRAWELGAREHLLVAAELVPPERRREAVEILVDRLGEGVSGIAVTAMVALRRLTGRSFALQPLSWKSWWKEAGGNEVD